MALAISTPQACSTSAAASVRNRTAHGSISLWRCTGSRDRAGTGPYSVSNISVHLQSRATTGQRMMKLSLTSLRIRCDLPEADRKVASNSGNTTTMGTRERTFPTFLTQQGWKVAVASTIAALTLLQSGDIALAYKGGGPYGIGVTRGQDLSYKDFSGQDLTQQDFKTSILRQTKFKGAKLLGASFFDADLTGADFSDSDLRGADFSLASAKGADFTNAVLEGALVTGNTSFKGSTITGADFTDVNFREDQRRELCQVASGVNPLTGNETRTTLYCD